MTSERPITLGIIGKGPWGLNYIRTIKTGVPGVTLPQENIFGRDYQEHLKFLIADGVIIATSTDTHFEVATALLNAGFLKLLIEKPVTQTLDEALKLQQTSKDLKASIMVGHIMLYDPAYQTMKRNKSLVGNTSSIIFRGLQSKPRLGVTTLQEWGPHPLYMFMDFIGEKPTAVIASPLKNSGEGNIRLTLHFDQVKATAEIGYDHPVKKREFTIIGDKGSISLDWSRPEKSLFYTKPGQPPRQLVFPRTQSPLKLEMLEFANLIRGKTQTRSPLSQGVEVMRIISLAEKSLSIGAKTSTENS